MLTSPIINVSKDLIISSTVLVVGKSNPAYFLSASFPSKFSSSATYLLLYHFEMSANST